MVSFSVATAICTLKMVSIRSNLEKCQRIFCKCDICISTEKNRICVISYKKLKYIKI